MNGILGEQQLSEISKALSSIAKCSACSISDTANRYISTAMEFDNAMARVQEHVDYKGDRMVDNDYFAKLVLKNDSCLFIPEIKEVLVHYPATIVFWKDGTKTVTKPHGDDEWCMETAVAMAFMKKMFGRGKYLKKVAYWEKRNKKNFDKYKKKMAIKESFDSYISKAIEDRKESIMNLNK